MFSGTPSARLGEFRTSSVVSRWKVCKRDMADSGESRCCKGTARDRKVAGGLRVALCSAAAPAVRLTTR